MWCTIMILGLDQKQMGFSKSDSHRYIYMSFFKKKANDLMLMVVNCRTVCPKGNTSVKFRFSCLSCTIHESVFLI